MLALKFLNKLSSVGLLVMRMGLGFIFIIHGSQKMFAGPTRWEMLGGVMSHLGITFYPVVWGFLAAFAEFGGGILFVLGFLFRPAAIMMCFTMAMAVTHHVYSGDTFKVYAHALSLGMVFFGLIFVGPGKFSIDGE